MIVTIQPEFKTKSTDEKDNTSFDQCLIGCQSLECAPKTCCSTISLDAILIDGDLKKTKHSKKSKSDRKSNSMLSLNVSSLAKLRKLTGSTQDIIKKSVSESHVNRTQISDYSSTDSQNLSTNTSSVGNNLYSMNNSIDELKEKDFHEQCDERSEQRLPPTETQSQPQKNESIAEHEDSSLLDKSASSPHDTSSTHINDIKSP